MKACCGFGHRNVFENISSKLDNAVEEAIAEPQKPFVLCRFQQLNSREDIMSQRQRFHRHCSRYTMAFCYMDFLSLFIALSQTLFAVSASLNP